MKSDTIFVKPKLIKDVDDIIVVAKIDIADVSLSDKIEHT